MDDEALLKLLTEIFEAEETDRAVSFPDYEYLAESGLAEQVPPSITAQHGGSRTRFTGKGTQLRLDMIQLTNAGKDKLVQLQAAAS